jgi:hypothetical protein
MGWSAEELMEFDAALLAGLQEGAEKAGLRVSSWLGTKREIVNKLSVLLSEYHRLSVQPAGGVWHVRLFRVYDGHRSFTLTISYELAAARVLRPITDRIAYSLRPEVGPH